MFESPAECAGILRDAGISPSPQRLAIFTYLRNHRNHPTAEMIGKEVREQLPGMSLTTVYNTLKLRGKKNMVHEVIIEDGELRYDADLRDHGHFKCLSCGEVYDFFPDEKELEFLNTSLPEGFRITSTHLCCRGICDKPACRVPSL